MPSAATALPCSQEQEWEETGWKELLEKLEGSGGKAMCSSLWLCILQAPLSAFKALAPNSHWLGAVLGAISLFAV